MFKIKFITNENYQRAINLLQEKGIYYFTINNRRNYILVKEITKDLILEITKLDGRIIEEYQYHYE